MATAESELTCDEVRFPGGDEVAATLKRHLARALPTGRGVDRLACARSLVLLDALLPVLADHHDRGLLALTTADLRAALDLERLRDLAGDERVSLRRRRGLVQYLDELDRDIAASVDPAGLIEARHLTLVRVLCEGARRLDHWPAFDAGGEG